jgi:hypothetical protein
MLAGPRSDPNPFDPHTAVGGLIEAFDEVLDLGQHLLILPWPAPAWSMSIMMARWK